MSKLTNQWVDLFEAGNYGDKGTFSNADIDQIIANYDPAHHEAPAVIGHPKTDGPAYGWVESLRRVGARLQGTFKQVVPGFEDAVESGRYKKRSVSLYNGAKGWSLRHVGFLGAQPPEIKGLADIKFESSEDRESIDIEFAEESDMSEPENQKKFMDGLTEIFRQYFPKKDADSGAKQFSEDDVKRIATEAAAAAVAPVQAELDKQKNTFSESQTAAEKAAATARASDAISGIKTAGKWVPAFDRAGLPLLFNELAKATATVEFGEGAEKKTLTPLQVLVAFMEALPKIVPTGRTVEPGSPSGEVRTFAENADPNSIKLNTLAEELMAKDKITFGEALQKAAAAHPELTRKGGSTASAV